MINTGLSERLISLIINKIIHFRSVNRIILYGSRARGDFKKTSDIDLAIESSQSIVGIKDFMEEELPTLLKFDVVDLNKAGEKLRKQILQQGIVLYERNFSH